MNKERPTPTPAKSKGASELTIDSQTWLNQFKKKYPLKAILNEMQLGNGPFKALKNIFSK